MSTIEKGKASPLEQAKLIQEMQKLIQEKGLDAKLIADEKVSNHPILSECTACTLCPCMICP